MSTSTPGPADENPETSETPEAERTQAVPPPPSTDPTQVLNRGETRASGGAGQTLVAALKDQLGVLTRLGKNNVVDAFGFASRSPWLWVVTAVIGAVLTGLLFATTIARVSGSAMSSVSMLFSGSTVYSGIGFGSWLGMLVMGVVLVGIIMGLRVVALHLTYRLAGKPQPFTASLSLTATAYSIHLPVMVLVLVLMLIPGRSWVMIVAALGAYLWLVCALLSELLVYIGLNRTTAFPNSPFRIHAIATAVWIAAAGLVLLLATTILGDMGTSAVGGML